MTTRRPLYAIIPLATLGALLVAPGRAVADPSAFYGGFEEDVPIVVPPFQGIEPKLSLHYNSSGGNGPVGVGWTLSGFSTIERASPGGGAPKYNSTDIFLLDGQQLTPCVAGSMSPSCMTGGTHSTKIENYARIAYNGSSWTVTQKDGIKITFNPLFQVVVAGATQSWKWGIATVVDPLRNTTTYSWGSNGLNSCCWEYPKSVSYNNMTVTFYWETRPDAETHADGVGFATYYGRIKTIDVFVTSLNTRVRTYKLSYTTSGSTARSLLASVQQFGKDATFDATMTVTGGTSMPATVFTPSTETHTLQDDKAWVTPPAYGNWSIDANSRRYMMDVNGDGKADVVLGPDASGSWFVMLSTGISFVNKGAWITGAYANWSNDSNMRRYPMDVNGDGLMDMVLGPDASGNWYVLRSTGTSFVNDGAWITGAYGNWSTDGNMRRYPMDVNGDGKTDMVLGPDASGNWFVLMSTGTKFVDAHAWSAAPAYGNWSSDGNSRRYLMDVNGDGKTDIVLGPDASGNWFLMRSTGTSFVDDGALITGAYGNWSTDGFLRRYPMDVNGDGKMDLVLGPDSSGNWFVLRSTGTTFVDDHTWATGAYGSWSVDATARRYPMDLNGDGKTDMLLGPDGSGNWFVLRSTGSSFANDGAWITGVYGSWGADTTRRRYPVDANGDGKADMVLGPDGAGNWFVLQPQFGAVDLIQRIDNGLGAYTVLGYLPSSRWTNTNNPPIVQTVSQATTWDGRGNSSTTNYSYAGGLWDSVGRQFLGFQYSKRALPCLSTETAPACPYEETWFAQNYGSISKPQTIRRSSGAGVLLLEKDYQYATNGSTIPYQSLEIGAWVYVYDGSGNSCSWPSSAGTGPTCAYGARSYVGHAYDNYAPANGSFNAGYANIVSETTYGNYDVAGDEVTVTYSYYPNTAAFITDKQSVISTYAGLGTGGSLLSEGLFYYDGATAYSMPPTRGKPTTSLMWLNTTGAFVSKTATYDPYGNVASETDGNGATTTYGNDVNFHQYIVSTSNALGQIATANWDPGCSVRTGITDPNGRTTTMTYDNLCRLTFTAYPLGAFEQRQYINVGNAATGYVEIDTLAADASGNQWTRTYTDGLGRTYLSTHKGPSSAVTISQVTEYNPRGQVSRSSAPYSTLETPQDETNTYDAMDRVTQITHADGATVTKSYGIFGGWGSVTTTDELGHQQRDTSDTAGRPKWHDEWFGTTEQTRTSNYDLRGNLSQINDSQGNVWSFTFDSLGRKIASTDPDAGSWSYSYDNGGRLVSQTDAKEQTTTFAYDALGRRTQKVTLAGTPQATVATWTYDQPVAGYSNVGHVTTVSNPSASSVFDYDALGRVVTSSRVIGGLNGTTQFGYDAGSRLLWTQYPDGDTVGTATNPLTYDGAGRLYSIPGVVGSFVYDARGNVLTQTNANTTVTKKLYSPTRFWLTGIATQGGTGKQGITTIQNLGYTPDAEGKITAVTSPVAYEGWTYGYDQHRLNAANNTTNAAYSYAFAYDSIGNMTSNTGVGSYTYPPAGAPRPHAVAAVDPLCQRE